MATSDILGAPGSAARGRARARDLGITIGRLAAGPRNAITDVLGVRVGHSTLIAGEGPLVVGRGPVCTGVTVILPHAENVGGDPVFAGAHVLNGNGEMTVLWLPRPSISSAINEGTGTPRRMEKPLSRPHAPTRGLTQPSHLQGACARRDEVVAPLQRHFRLCQLCDHFCQLCDHYGLGHMTRDILGKAAFGIRVSPPIKRFDLLRRIVRA